jgi:hypothetical protein
VDEWTKIIKQDSERKKEILCTSEREYICE